MTTDADIMHMRYVACSQNLKVANHLIEMLMCLSVFVDLQL